MKLIGMIHLDALPGYPQHKGMSKVLEHALYDAHQLENGGINSILLENTYDDPQQKILGTEQIVAYTVAAQKVRENIQVPLGICCLFNDYKSALSIAKVVGADFVRIPVFTEAVLTSYGFMEGNPYDVITFRHKIDANDIRILADVRVKHAHPLSERPIEESAEEILNSRADELVITGRYTGDVPALDDLKAVRTALPNSYINIGSGTNPDNIQTLGLYANAVIVGTYLKDNNGRMCSSRVESLRQLIQNEPINL